MRNTIFFLISGGFKRQSFSLLNIEIWQRAQIMRVLEWQFEWTSTLSWISCLWRLGFHVQTTFSEKCYFWVLQYRTGSQLVLNKAILIQFQFYFNFVSINEKMCLSKELDMNDESQKSIIQKFWISTSVLSGNS